MKFSVLKYSKFCFLAVAMYLMTSCISSYDTNYLQSIPENYDLVSFQEYRLQTKDELGCQIFTNDPEVRTMFQGVVSLNLSSGGISLYVYENGEVIIPFFGSVNVINLTLQEAEVKIQDLLKKSFNDIQVKLVQLNNNFYIYSSQKTGRYKVYKENMTIYQALAISGQTTNQMDISKVKIIRKDSNGQDIIKEFDLRSQDVVQSEFYYIKPNDQIYFPTNENAFFNMTSAQSFSTVVLNPLIYLFVVLKISN